MALTGITTSVYADDETGMRGMGCTSPSDTAASPSSPSSASLAFRVSAGTARELERVTKGSPLLRQAAAMTAVATCLWRYDPSNLHVLGTTLQANGLDTRGQPRAVPIELSGRMTFREALALMRQRLLEGKASPSSPLASSDGTTVSDLLVRLIDLSASVERPSTLPCIDFVFEPASVTGCITYEPDKYGTAQMARLADHLVHCLDRGFSEPAVPLEDLGLMGDDEQQRVTALFAKNPGCSLDAPTVIDAFERQARATPDRVALTTPSTCLTFEALDARADRICSALLARAVHPEDRVAVLAPRCAELVVALLGVMKAGAAYVPLDPDWPVERRLQMITASGSTAILTLPEWEAQLLATSIPLVDIARAADAMPSSAPVRCQRHRATLAYVVYTSGSTGDAKGVCVSHGALAARVAGMVDRYRLNRDDRVLQFLSPSADAFGEELYPALVSGATLVLVPTISRMAPREALVTLEREGTTVLHFPAAYWGGVAAATAATGRPLTPAVRLCIVGGEAPDPAAVRDWVSRVAVSSVFVNAYGPTEATITATTHTVDASNSRCVLDTARIPIGTPMPGTAVYVLDERLRPVPIGAAGEICIGGAAVARGYLGSPAATAARFLPDTWAEPGARMYRTGDRGRWLDDGSIEFLGRDDDQFKLRGHRIEPAEIESALSQHTGVRQSVIVKEGAGDDARLVAYVVARRRAVSANPAVSSAGPPGNATLGDVGDETPVDGLELQSLTEHLRRSLPGWMVPSAFYEVDAFPLTLTGKIDRKSVCGGRPIAASIRVLRPRDSIEAQVANVWSDLLGTVGFGIRDDFFAIGGHSLRAVVLAAKLEQLYGSRIPVRMVFDHPTVEQQAAFIRQERSTQLPTVLVPLRGTGVLRPIFFVHPGGGLVQAYSELARSLNPQRPVYGFQSVGFAPAEAPARRVEEMAVRYIAAMRSVQPEGPYQIAGLSSGCVVAYEMAQQIEAVGQRVSFLGLLDGAAVPEPKVLSDDEWSRQLEAWVDRYPVWRAAVELGIDEVEMSARERDDRFQVYLSAAKDRDILPRDVTLEQFVRFVRVYGSNVLALNQYAPKPYAGAVTLIRTPLAEGADTTLGWQRVAPHIRVHELPGSHAGFVRGEHAPALAALIESLVDGAVE